MKIESSIKNWFTTFGYSHRAVPGVNEHWYDRIEDLMGDPEWDHYQIKPEIKEWLNSVLPGRHRLIKHVRPNRDGARNAWLSPIYFKKKSDALLFRMTWG